MTVESKPVRIEITYRESGLFPTNQTFEVPAGNCPMQYAARITTGNNWESIGVATTGRDGKIRNRNPKVWK